MAWLTDKLLFTKPSRRLMDPAEVIMHGLHNECPLELASFFKPLCWRAERLFVQLEAEDFDMNVIWDRLGIRREIDCLTNYLLPYYPYFFKFLLVVVLLYACTAPLWVLLWHKINGQQTDLWTPDANENNFTEDTFEVAPLRAMERIGLSSASQPSTSEGTDTVHDRPTANEPVVQARTIPRDSNPTVSRCERRSPPVSVASREEMFRHLRVDDVADKGPLFEMNCSQPETRCGSVTPAHNSTSQCSGCRRFSTHRSKHPTVKPETIRAWKEFYHTLNENLEAVLNSCGNDNSPSNINDLTCVLKNRGKVVDDHFQTMEQEQARG